MAKESDLEPSLGKEVVFMLRPPGRGTGGGLSAQCEASSASRGGSKPMNKAPASSVPYTQVSIINLRIRGPPAPSEGCAARVTSPPTSSGRALTRTTSEQAEGPGSASKQPGGPRWGDPAPQPSPAPRPAAGGSPIKPCPGSREAAARAPQPSATFPSLAPASPPGSGPVGRPPARPPSFSPPPRPRAAGRPAGRPRAAAPPPKMAGPSLRPAGLGGGGEAGRPVAAAADGGFFFPEEDFVNLTKWRALQSCAARSAGARAAAAAAAPQPGEPEPPAPESPHGQTDTHSHSLTHTRARTLPDLGRDQQQRRQQSPRIPPPLSPPPPPPHSNGAFYYYSGGKRKGLKKNPTNKMATDRPGRYSNCQSKRNPPPPAADVLTSSSRHPRPQAGGRGLLLGQRQIPFPSFSLRSPTPRPPSPTDQPPNPPQVT
nr:uncharacterized protein LOC110123105 [Odocoileus virginianus texanus]